MVLTLSAPKLRTAPKLKTSAIDDETQRLVQDAATVARVPQPEVAAPSPPRVASTAVPDTTTSAVQAATPGTVVGTEDKGTAPPRDNAPRGAVDNPVTGTDAYKAPDTSTPSTSVTVGAPGSSMGAVTPADLANRTNATAQDNSNEGFDRAVRSLLGDLVAGKGMQTDTSAEEALVRELMQDQIGKGLVDQRASMGRAGFGASGALAAMEADTRRTAGQRATQETLALRRQAEQDAIDAALRGVGVDIDKRDQARQEFFDREYLNALRSFLGQDPLTPEGDPVSTAVGNAVTGAVTAVPNLPIFNGGVETETPATATAGSGRQVVSAPPAGYVLYQRMSNGDELWKSPSDPGDNSTVVVVRKGAA